MAKPPTRSPKALTRARERLARDQPLANPLNDFGIVGKRRMVKMIGAALIAEINHVDAGIGERRAVRFGQGIDLPKPRDVAGEQARGPQSRVVTRDKHGEARPRLSNAAPLRGEYIDIDIRRGQYDVANFRRHAAIPDRHLTQGFHQQPRAHRMGHDGDLSDAGIARHAPQRFFERVAGGDGALPVIDVLEDASPRRPCEQDRGGVRAGIMCDLGQSIDRVFETIVEAMHEDEHAAVMRQIALQPRLRLTRICKRGDGERGEIGLRIGRQARGPLHLTHLPVVGRRD